MDMGFPVLMKGGFCGKYCSVNVGAADVPEHSNLL